MWKKRPERERECRGTGRDEEGLGRVALRERFGEEAESVLTEEGLEVAGEGGGAAGRDVARPSGFLALATGTRRCTTSAGLAVVVCPMSFDTSAGRRRRSPSPSSLSEVSSVDAG